MGDSTWLKIMSNGALGEARVRALLLERFHVLTRSIDADGADFLIQLSGTGRFSDDLAPRLGIIQAKFAQDDATSHIIPVDYTLAAGRTIDEFFVLVTVGREDNTKNYILSATDLKNVARTKRDGKDVYNLTAKDRKPFFQKSIAKILDAIESSLRKRSDEQNERFYKTVTIPDFPFKRSSLEPKWLLPIPNEVGYIPDIIYRLRIMMRTQLYAFDDVTAAISKLLTSKDADECVASAGMIIDDPAYQQVDGEEFLRFGNFQLQVPKDTLSRAAIIHNKRINALRRAKQFDRYVAAAAIIQDDHITFYNGHKQVKLIPPKAKSQTISREHARTTIILDPLNLDVVGSNTELVPEGSYDIVHGRNKIIRSRELWRYSANEGPVAAWRELDRLKHLLLVDIYRLMFPKENLGDPILPVYMAE
jgi:hypothetical protein